MTRAAGLLLAQIADHFEESWAALTHLPAPGPLHGQVDLVGRVDSGVPREAVVAELAWDRSEGLPRPGEPALVPLVERDRLEEMVADLFEEFGAASFTVAWQRDPHGLLDAALELLSDLSLVRPVPGGVLVTPAALRYRNIRGALPERPDTGLLPFGPIEPADEPATETMSDPGTEDPEP